MNTKKLFRAIALLLLTVGFATRLTAQEISILVTPTQDILPPQVGLYIDNPQRFFNVTLINNTAEEQNVFLGLRIDQISPESQLKLLTTARRMPQTPLVVRAHESKQLTMVEQKNMFRYLPLNEVYISDGMYSNYENGIFGLMPEGTYTISITAYRWLPGLTTPEVLSSPNTGLCTFRVCYTVQAPQWLAPMTGIGGFDLGIATLQKSNPMFSWTPSVLPCNSTLSQFRYDFRIVELLPGQSPDQAMDRNASIYERTGLMTSNLMLPASYLNKLKLGTNYVAQVTSRPVNTGALQEGSLNFMSMENEGKSTLLMFQLGKDPFDDEPEEQTADDTEESSDTDEGTGVVPGGGGSWSKEGTDIDDDNDSLYVFSMPELIEPKFVGGRKLFEDENLICSWHKAWYEGGRGDRQDTIKFKYHVMLFKASPRDNWETIFKQKPLFKKETEDLNATILWDDIENNVTHGDYIVMRIKPECLNEKSIRFLPDSANVTDFAITSRYSKVAQCNSTVSVTNKTPIKQLQAGDMVAIGEYNMKVKTARRNNDKRSFNGTGEIEWTPIGMKIMVQVKFDTLFINTEKQVFDGVAYTYHGSEDKDVSSVDAVDKLFSDWGVDNFMTDLSLPGEVRSAVTKGAKDVAQTLELNKYYNYIKTAKTVWNDGRNKTINNCYLPLKLPKSVNPTPADLQIASMKFKWNSAQMNIIGEFKVPKSKATDDLLILGAPRLCMSPNDVLPETGYVCLLADFKVKDPDSQFNMSFNAPTDVQSPVNGCFVSWQSNKFQRFHADIDVRVPHLKRVVNNKVLDEQPAFNFQTDIESWDNWIAKGNIPEFEIEDVPGWRFKAGGDVVYDHKTKENDPAMKNFKWPENYNYEEAGISKGNLNPWQGLYIEDISVTFPGALYVDDTEDHRFSISFKNMLVDRSGATFTAQASQLVQGSLCGWGFELKKAWFDVLQNDFSKCGFNGSISVPLISNKFNYDCTIYNQRVSGKGNSGFAYVFKTQMGDSLDTEFDWILAQTTLYRDQTYFLLEALDQPDGTTKTDLELCMGGKIGIGALKGASAKLEELTAKLPLKLRIPDIHFSGMRLSNSDVGWKSIYARSLQNKRDESEKTKMEELSKLKKLYEIDDKQVVFGEGSSDKIYFNRGKWSLASFSKEIGPFKFSVEDFDFNLNGKNLELGIKGRIGLLDTLICADGKVTLIAEAKNLDNIRKFAIEYKDTRFDDINLNTNFAGIGMKGSLKLPSQKGKANSTGGKDNGYEGNVEFDLKGLFTAKVNGGFYEHTGSDGTYSWGFFNVGLGSAVGVPIPPVKITDITGGFYFNCARNVQNRNTANPKKGCIGVNVGLGLSTEDGGLLKGDFDLTVVYDKRKNRLTTFMLNGDLKGVGGLIDAKASIVYENNQTDKYFNLNVTADAKVDPVGLATALTEYSSELSAFAETLKDIKGEAVETFNAATGDLASKIGATEKLADPPKGGRKDTSDEIHAGASASLTLDFRITKKRNGETYNKAKWHLYLGEPEESKRCKLTIIDFKSPIVSVRIGADAYLCLGNELPNDGQLPPIPTEISNFLNGGSNQGFESANLSEATAERRKAMENFSADARNPQFGGGVMFGAKAYGYVNVDLGLLYGDFTMIGGFDVALGKLKKDFCMNAKGGHMGYNGWYGTGQIYAYLAAKFGIRVYLGFYNEKFDILDAELGGMFKCGMPNPIWFKGQARCRLELLGGLVKINRKFSFECGKVCEPFYGNALDDFELFAGSDFAFETPDDGFKDENVRPNSVSGIRFQTTAPINEHFRVLDRNSLEQLKKNYKGDEKKLENQANRTFRFNIKESWLTGYKKEYVQDKSYLKDSVTLNLSKSSRHVKLYNDPNLRGITQESYNKSASVVSLNAATHWVLSVTGEAKEVVKGQYVDPEYTNPETGEYKKNKPWQQTKHYFFRTLGSDSLDIPDVLDLNDYVAIAYPSDCNRLQSSTSLNKKGKEEQQVVTAYIDDVRNPLICLNSIAPLSAFKRGSLLWKWVDYQTKEEKWSSSNVTDKLEHENGVYNMRPVSPYQGAAAGKEYGLQLLYRTQEHDTLDNGRVKDFYSDTLLVNLRVVGKEGFWITGGYNDQKDKELGDNYVMAAFNMLLKGPKYEHPFIGTRLEEITYTYGNATGDNSWKLNSNITYNDLFLSTGNAQVTNASGERLPLLMADPNVYFAYLSRWAFIGGHYAGKYGFDTKFVQSTESAIFNGYSSTWTKPLVSSLNTPIADDWAEMRSLSVYDKKQWSKNEDYPLPYLNGESYPRVIQRGPHLTPLFAYGSTDKAQLRNLLHLIMSPYLTAQRAQHDIAEEMKCFESFKVEGKTWTVDKVDNDYKLIYAKAFAQSYNEQHRSQYLQVGSDTQYGSSLKIPYYQFPFLFGGRFENHGSNATEKIPLKYSFSKNDIGDRERWSYNEAIWGSFTNCKARTKISGHDNLYDGNRVKALPFDPIKAAKCIKRIKATVYRVNAYETRTGKYKVLDPSLYVNAVYQNSMKTITIDKPFSDWTTGVKNY